MQFFIADTAQRRGHRARGFGGFKTELSTGCLTRACCAVIKPVDVSYGESGFNQAIELSAETLGSVKLVQEKRLIQKYFDEISQDTGRYCSCRTR